MLEAATRTGFCPSCGFNLTKDEPIERDGFVIDPRGVVTFEGRQVPLQAGEIIFVHSIAAGEGRCVPISALLERMDSESKDPLGLLHTRLCMIRKRFFGVGAPNPIRTVWGRGYRWGLT
jgi:DNA-binding response OmpR family regulator